MKNGALLPLRLSEVSFAAGGRAIIDGISLEIEAGQSTIILGANGAGKSVLMRLMHGLLQPTSGHVEWSAQEVKGAPRKQAMVFQRPVMLRRSARANVAFALKMGGVAEGPFVGATGFAVKFRMDIKDNSTGRRTLMEEIGVYTVLKGKIIQEEFMYGAMTPIEASMPDPLGTR